MTTEKTLSQACREVASHFEGDVGVTLFDWYDAINRRFFAGQLPQAFILTALTAYGRCVGLTKSHTHKQPIILIHPSLDTDKDKFYTLLHEAIHVHVDYNLRQASSGNTSHSTPGWIAEVNRIAKMLGYADVELGVNKVTRVKGAGLARKVTGNVPYECTYCFPHPLEKATGRQLPPISTWLENVTYNNV